MKTGWQKIGKWDNAYFQEHLIGPGTLKLMNLRSGDSLLDLACGDQWLSRKIPKGVHYMGFDLVGGVDVTKPLPTNEQFSHAAIVLALQNIEYPGRVIQNAADHLTSGGKLIIVLNHPAFRIPRQTSWEIDSNNKLQYRRINRYMSPLKIPVRMHPGQTHGPMTWSFHHPISYYVSLLSSQGFVIERLEEWTSDKESAGKAARMENRSRSEFPLFLVILARKDG